MDKPYELTVERKSPSPRRAWIEIFDAPLCEPGGAVALPTEGVD